MAVFFIRVALLPTIIWCHMTLGHMSYIIIIMAEYNYYCDMLALVRLSNFVSTPRFLLFYFWILEKNWDLSSQDSTQRGSHTWASDTNAAPTVCWYDTLNVMLHLLKDTIRTCTTAPPPTISFAITLPCTNSWVGTGMEWVESNVICKNYKSWLEVYAQWHLGNISNSLFSEIFVFAHSEGFVGCKIEDSICSRQPCHKAASTVETCRWAL